MADNGKGYGKLIEYFYSHFILRDFFGKIIPGSIVIITISSALLNYNDFWKIFDYLKEIWLWIFFIGISWIAGFTIQSIGERIPRFYIRYYPPCPLINKKIINLNDKIWYKLRKIFHESSNDYENQKSERLVVITEACGNGYVAFMIIFFIIFVNIIHRLFTNIPRYSILSNYIVNRPIEIFYLVIIILIAIIFLRLMHTRHIQRQFKLMRNCKEVEENLKKISDDLNEDSGGKEMKVNNEKKVTNEDIIKELKKNNVYTIFFSILFFVFAITIAFLNIYLINNNTTFLWLMIGSFLITALVSGLLMGYSISDIIKNILEKRKKS